MPLPSDVRTKGAYPPEGTIPRTKKLFDDLPALGLPPIKMGAEDLEEQVLREHQASWEQVLAAYQASDVSGLSFLVEAIWNKISIFFLPMWDGISNSLAIYSQLAVKKIWDSLPFFVMPKDSFDPPFNLMDALSKVENTTDLWDVIARMRDEHPVISIPFMALITGFEAAIMFYTAMSARREKIEHAVNVAERPAIPSLGDILSLKWRSSVPSSTLTEFIRKLGFPENLVAEFIKASEQPLTPVGIGELLNRGFISNAEADTLLERNQTGPEGRSLIKKLFRVIPPVQDLVRFVVREAFNEDIVRKYGLDEGFSSEFRDAASKVGLDEVWSKMYWRAHWELPSLTMGYDMLQRGIIDKDDLLTLMKSQDVMPYWRQKLMDLSFNTYTRVDIRRMYEAGILDEAGVYKAYLDVGYDPDRATNMTAFTIKLYEIEQKEATKGDILGAFKKAVLTEPEARKMLKDIGYGENLSELLILKENFDKTAKRRDAAARFIRKIYVAGRIEMADALVRLAAEQIVGQEASDMIADWEIERKQQESFVSWDQLVDMLKAGIISAETLAKELDTKGYDIVDIGRLVELAKIKAKEK